MIINRLHTFENTCREVPDLLFGDESVKIVVNIQGSNGEISAPLRNLLDYLNTGKPSDPFTNDLDEAVKKV